MKKPRPAASKATKGIRATPAKKVIKEIRETKAIKEIREILAAEKKCPTMILFRR